MALYRVAWDGIDILDYSNPKTVLLAPDLEQEINVAGSFEFVVPPYNLYYDMFTPESMISPTVEIYEDDELIWFGRPMEIEMDFFKQKKIYCEGALAFFNDSIQPDFEYNSISIQDFFRHLVSVHNSAVKPNRQFSIGRITIDNKSVYRKTHYETTLDALKSMCLDTNDGYFFIRRVNGVNYIDWLKEMPYQSNQTVEFAINLLNLKDGFDGTDFCTCVIPLGKNDNEGNPTTVKAVNNGKETIESDAVALYGKITKVLNLPDINSPSELYLEGVKFLKDAQFNTSLIECSAADLHTHNQDLTFFKLGQTLHVKSIPHVVDKELPLSKMTLRLDTAAKQITLGIIKKKTLSRIYKDDSQSSDSSGGSQFGAGDLTDGEGINWEIIPPENDGDPVTAFRYPTNIRIVREPNKWVYKPNEKLDFTGILVRIEIDGHLWTCLGNPVDHPRYITGEAPFSELSFSATHAPPERVPFGVLIVVTWSYKDHSYSDNYRIMMPEVAIQGLISTGDWEDCNWQGENEHNTIKFSRSGIHYIGVVSPNKHFYIACVDPESTEPFTVEYRSRRDDRDYPEGRGSSTIMQIDGMQMAGMISGSWWSPIVTVYEIPTVSAPTNSTESIRQAGLNALFGKTVIIG